MVNDEWLWFIILDGRMVQMEKQMLEKKHKTVYPPHLKVQIHKPLRFEENLIPCWNWRWFLNTDLLFITWGYLGPPTTKRVLYSGVHCHDSFCWGYRTLLVLPRNLVQILALQVRLCAHRTGIIVNCHCTVSHHVGAGSDWMFFGASSVIKQGSWWQNIGCRRRIENLVMLPKLWQNPY